MTEQPASAANVSADFVFGTLATDDLRLAQLRAARSGVTHGHRLTPQDPLPDQPVQIEVTTGPAAPCERVTCYFTADGAEPVGSRGVAERGIAVELQQAAVEWDTLLWGYVARWTGELAPHPAGTLVRYRVEAWSAQGPSFWASEIAGVVTGERPADLNPTDAELFNLPGSQPLWPIRRSGSFAYHVDKEQVPDWLRDAVIYQVFVDRFATTAARSFDTPDSPGGFFGGTLRGVIERLPYLEALGATVLWLSPIFPSHSHHGYDAYDYMAVEPRLGTLDDLRELTAAAHARGMRVLLDFVANHISSHHPAFQRALADAESPEAGWFTFTRWPDQYLSFFGVLDHPQINSDNPDARAAMIASASFWLEQGVDGFRLDYANGPSHAFWSQFRAATRAIRRDSVTIGEVVETPALQQSYTGRMDGCLDFLLMQALRQLFAFRSLPVSAFDAFLRRHLAFFGDNFVLPSFLDNHDMNRALWVLRGDTRRLRLAALCQFTLPPPPIIYYGTEAGLNQKRDVRYPDGSGHPEESRLPMPWEAQDAELHAFYSALVALRRATPALWRGQRNTLLLDDAKGLYAYACAAEGHTALVALNTGNAAQIVPLPAGAWQLALASDPALAVEGGSLTLPGGTGVVLQAR